MKIINFNLYDDVISYLELQNDIISPFFAKYEISIVQSRGAFEYNRRASKKEWFVPKIFHARSKI